MNYLFTMTLKKQKGKSLYSYVNEENKHLAKDAAIDLLSRMIIYDPQERITCKEAMDHPYFDPVRKVIRK